MNFLKFCIIILFTVFLLSGKTQAQDQSVPLLDRTDIIIIVDESGSLRYTDPDQLRFDALGFLKSFKGDTFRGSLLGFSDEVRFYTASDNSVGKFVSWSEVCTAISILRKAKFGEFTDIKKALEIAYDTFQKRNRNYPGYVMLFTDGRPEPDIPLNEDTIKFMKKYMTELDLLVNQYSDSDLRIYPIAFSDNVDKNFLQRIAEKTNGKVFGATTPGDIAPALSEVLTGFQIKLTIPSESNDLDKGVYEKEIEVSAGTIELRVEIFKNEPSDEFPEIHITDPKGNERSLEIINNRIASVASITEPSPSGIWKVSVKGKNVGKVTIKVSQLPGLRLEVISPEPKAEYKYNVPLSVSLHRLSEKSSTENVQITARIRCPDYEWAEVNMTKPTVSRQNWYSEYAFEQKRGEYTVFFDVKIGEVIFSSGEQVSFNGLPRPIVKAVKNGSPSQDGEKIQQRYVLEVFNLFDNIKYKLDHIEGAPEGVHAELSDLTVSPENGTAKIPFTVNIWTDKPLLDELVFSAVLVPTSGSQELKELLTVNIPLGPISGKPRIRLVDIDSTKFYIGQSVTLRAKARGKKGLPKTIQARCLGPSGQTQRVDLNMTSNADYEGTFQGLNEAGLWTFELDSTSPLFEPEGKSIDITAEAPTLSISAKDCKVNSNKDVPLSVRITGESLYLRRDVALRVADERVVFHDIPLSIPIEPTDTGKTMKEVELLVGAGTQGLPPWPSGWEISIGLVDVGSGEELASTNVKICGPMPLIVYAIVAALCIVTGFLLFFRYRKNFPPEAKLDMLTSRGRREDLINLRDKTGFFKRKLTIGSEKDDIDIDKETTIFALVPCPKGVLLIPWEKDRITFEKDEQVEFINTRTVWVTGIVIIVDDDRRIRLAFRSEEDAYNDSFGDDDL